MESLAGLKIIWRVLSMILLILVIGVLILLYLKGGEVNLWFFSVKIPPSGSA